MSKPVVEVKVRAMAAASGGVALFVGNEDKVFVMFVDQSVGTAITMFMQGTQKQRPLTHDLLASILRALGAKIERVVVNELKSGTYLARLVLSVENELKQKKIIEIDARPSDCIAMATAQRAPIYVSLDVWDEVEDMTEALRKMQEEGSYTEEPTRKRNRRNDGVDEISATGFCRHKGFSRSLDSASFDAVVLVVSALFLSGQIHLTQSWYFLSYVKKCAPKCSLAFNSQGERFKLLESCQLTA
jgi:uncharacterized protein